MSTLVTGTRWPSLADRMLRPVTTSNWRGPSRTQWAAVMTAVGEATVAPQYAPDWAERLCATSAAVHGAVPTGAGAPPTMRAGRVAAPAWLARPAAPHTAISATRGIIRIRTAASLPAPDKYGVSIRVGSDGKMDSPRPLDALDRPHRGRDGLRPSRWHDVVSPRGGLRRRGVRRPRGGVPAEERPSGNDLRHRRGDGDREGHHRAHPGQAAVADRRRRRAGHACLRPDLPSRRAEPAQGGVHAR